MSDTRKRSRPDDEDEENQTPPPRKRPGTTSRVSIATKEASRLRAAERVEAAETLVANRPIENSIREHYNAVPQRGREWRSTESKIKGLRKFNNWVKSTIINKSVPSHRSGLRVLDIGCGKGGDLGKWQSAPRPLDLYVGIDPADVSITQATERYNEMARRTRGNSLFSARFIAQDGFSTSISSIPIIREVGFDPHGRGGGGFDVVSMMFCMNYAFESEATARTMLSNVAGALKKDGRLIGTIPNSDFICEKIVQHFTNPDASSNPEWGNSLYRVRFPDNTPKDGVFRSPNGPYGAKYNYHLDEAVEAPEFVVPWGIFRALAEDYGLEMDHCWPFDEVWKSEKDHPVYGPLSERMGVKDRRTGKLLVTDEEMEAASFYHAFIFHKV